MSFAWVDAACADAAWDGEIPGAHDVRVLPDSLTVFYALEHAPTIADAERALGAARELPRGSAGPFQLAFPGRSSAFVAATTYDPPGAAERRILELMIRRDG